MKSELSDEDLPTWECLRGTFSHNPINGAAVRYSYDKWLVITIDFDWIINRIVQIAFVPLYLILCHVIRIQTALTLVLCSERIIFDICVYVEGKMSVCLHPLYQYRPYESLHVVFMGCHRLVDSLGSGPKLLNATIDCNIILWRPEILRSGLLIDLCRNFRIKISRR